MARNTDPNKCKNPRQMALMSLKQIKNALQWSINRMTTTGTVADLVPITITDQYGTRESTNPVYRPRRPEEYPENQAAEWLLLISNTTQMIAALESLRDRAIEERNRCQAGIYV